LKKVVVGSIQKGDIEAPVIGQLSGTFKSGKTTSNDDHSSWSSVLGVHASSMARF
jgi:hypothetical protein